MSVRRVSAIDLVWLAAYTGVCCGGAAGCAPSRIAHCCVPCLPAALQVCLSVVILSMELHAQEWGTNPWPLTRALLGNSQQPEVPSGSFLMLWDAASTVLELDTGQHNPNARMCCLKEGAGLLSGIWVGRLGYDVCAACNSRSVCIWLGEASCVPQQAAGCYAGGSCTDGHT